MHKTSFEHKTPESPRYWMNEASGRLRPVIEAYLSGNAMTPEQIVLMRDYLAQWIAGPWVNDPELLWLRENIAFVETREDIELWLQRAYAAEIDPL